jgi:membrane-associated phospholipid phosphatase
LGVFLLVVSLLIPASRVLAGVHFFKDVVAGWLLGALIGFVGMYLL